MKKSMISNKETLSIRFVKLPRELIITLRDSLQKSFLECAQSLLAMREQREAPNPISGAGN